MAKPKEKKKRHSFYNPDAGVRKNHYGIYDKAEEAWLNSDQCPWVRDEPLPFNQYIRWDSKRWF